jgi:hypothetical protein
MGPHTLNRAQQRQKLNVANRHRSAGQCVRVNWLRNDAR